MKKSIKIMVLGLTLAGAASCVQAADKSANVAPQAPASSGLQQLDNGVRTGLHYAGTGLAVAGLAVGTYQLVKALACWIAACQACNEEDSAELREKRNKSLAIMLAGFSTAGVIHALKNTNMSALIMHLDLGAVIAAIINALVNSKKA